MLSLEYIIQNRELVEKRLRDRGEDIDIDELINVNEKYKKALQDAESLRAERNQVSQVLSKDMNSEQREEHLREASNLKTALQDQENYLQKLKEKLDSILSSLPNIPYEEVPTGEDESANEVLRTVGDKPDFDFTPKSYLEIAQQHDLIDTERAAKVSGTRFGYIKNEAALLEFALVRFAFDVVKEENFSGIVPPVMVRPETMKALGYLEKEPEDLYYIEKDDMYLVGTSEQSVVPMHKDETLDAKDLPRRYAAFSTCFRREAGSYGKDTKGILRVHQFDKVEMVSFASPEKSKEEHETMLRIQEKLMQALEIPYQVVAISTGDMGFPAAQQFDIESWIPGENKYRETHSTSNTTDFQARRLNVRYKEGDKKDFVHILNGTAFAIGRTIISILENHQDKDGIVHIPEALQKYTGFNKIG